MRRCELHKSIGRRDFLKLTGVSVSGALLLWACRNNVPIELSPTHTIEAPTRVVNTLEPTRQPTSTVTPLPSPTPYPEFTFTLMGSEYPPKVLEMFEAGEFDGQTDHFKDWLNYWVRAQNPQLLFQAGSPEVIQMILKWDQTKQESALKPEDVGILFETNTIDANGDAVRKTIYFPKKIGAEGYKMEAPAPKEQPYSWSEGESYFELTGGDEGLTLEWVNGDWVRMETKKDGPVNEQGYWVREIIDPNGSWQKSSQVAEDLKILPDFDPCFKGAGSGVWNLADGRNGARLAKERGSQRQAGMEQNPV